MTDDEAMREAAEKMSKLFGNTPEELVDVLKMKVQFDQFRAKHGFASARALAATISLWLGHEMQAQEKDKPEAN